MSYAFGGYNVKLKKGTINFSIMTRVTSQALNNS